MEWRQHRGAVMVHPLATRAGQRQESVMSATEHADVGSPLRHHVDAGGPSACPGAPQDTACKPRPLPCASPARRRATPAMALEHATWRESVSKLVIRGDAVSARIRELPAPPAWGGPRSSTVRTSALRLIGPRRRRAESGDGDRRKAPVPPSGDTCATAAGARARGSGFRAAPDSGAGGPLNPAPVPVSATRAPTLHSNG